MRVTPALCPARKLRARSRAVSRRLAFPPSRLAGHRDAVRPRAANVPRRDTIKRLHPRAEVVGLDPDPKALGRARRKRRSGGRAAGFADVTELAPRATILGRVAYWRASA
jgi:hypothetical protein